MSDDTGSVRIRLNNPKQNKVKGFYLLMTNCDTYSDAQDEFVIEEMHLKLLDENKITYKKIGDNYDGCFKKTR